jgi:hypothetical protein
MDAYLIDASMLPMRMRSDFVQPLLALGYWIPQEMGEYLAMEAVARIMQKSMLGNPGAPHHQIPVG